MEESYFICTDEFGNRAVILCLAGLPVRGIAVPVDGGDTLAKDIAAMESGNPPLGGMLLDTPACISIMQTYGNDGITVSDRVITSSRELDDDEKDYISAR